MYLLIDNSLLFKFHEQIENLIINLKFLGIHNRPNTRQLFLYFFLFGQMAMWFWLHHHTSSLCTLWHICIESSRISIKSWMYSSYLLHDFVSPISWLASLFLKLNRKRCFGGQLWVYCTMIDVRFIRSIKVSKFIMNFQVTFRKPSSKIVHVFLKFIIRLPFHIIPNNFYFYRWTRWNTSCIYFTLE